MEDLETTYQKWEREERSPIRNILKNIPTNILFLILGILLIGYFSSQPQITSWEMMQFIGVALFIALAMGVQKAESKELTPAQAYAILKNEIIRKMEHEEMPRGEIVMGDQYTTVSRETPDGAKKPDFYAISFSIWDYETKMDTYYQGNVHAYTGTVLGIFVTPEGFDREKVKDVRTVVPTEFLKMRERMGRYEELREG